jgi:hypothetical protein
MSRYLDEFSGDRICVDYLTTQIQRIRQLL